MTLDATGRLTEAQLKMVEGIIGLNAADYLTNRRYYAGQNPIITDAPAKTAPDNRIPTPIARKVVNTVKGYMFKPGYISYSSEKDFANKLKMVFDANDEELLTAEIATDVLVNGYAFEVLRMDEDGRTIRQYRIEPGTGAVVYDSTLARKYLAFVHIVKSNDTGNIADDEYTRTVYYDDKYIVYTRGSGVADWTQKEEKAHPFIEVPAIEYTGSMDRLSLFEAVKAMIDQHDKILSGNYANEADRFAEAYLRILSSVDAETAAKLKELRMFQNLGDGQPGDDVAKKVDFLIKPDRGSTTAESADRFERLIYDLSMVINPNDFEAGTAIAGIAFKMKLLPMEFLAADIEAYFSKGLQRRIMLIGNAMRDVAPGPVTIHWRRNIPIDVESLAATAGALKGILSDETILNQFPGDIVPDKKAEMDRMAKQADARLPAIDDGIETGTEGVATTGQIQSTALNGAQIQALVGLVSAIGTGEVTKESALAIVSAAFPLLKPEQVSAIFDSIKQGTLKP